MSFSSDLFKSSGRCLADSAGIKVYAAGSEDMDTLTFNSPVVLRHLTFAEARKTPIDVISLDNVLAGLELTMDEERPSEPTSLSPSLTNPRLRICSSSTCACSAAATTSSPSAVSAPRLPTSSSRSTKRWRTSSPTLPRERTPRRRTGRTRRRASFSASPTLSRARRSPWVSFCLPLPGHRADWEFPAIQLEWKTPDVDGLIEFLVKENGFRFVPPSLSPLVFRFPTLL